MFSPGFVTKCIQLYETTVVRHGLMLVGPTCSGKTKCSGVLSKALTGIRGQPSVSGGTYETVHVSCIFDYIYEYEIAIKYGKFTNSIVLFALNLKRKVETLNPKSITMGQLYGEFDAMTHEWTDGILSTLIRQGVSATNEDKRW